VMRKTPASRHDDTLKFLISFLNFNLDLLEQALTEHETRGFSAQQIRERRLAGITGSRENAPVLRFLEEYGLTCPEKRDKAKAIQSELLDHLKVIASGEEERDDGIRKGYGVILGYLENLVTKINTLDVDPKLVIRPHGSQIKVDSEVVRKMYEDSFDGPMGKRMQVCDKPFILSERTNEPRSPEEYLYRLIRQTVLDNTLWKLARCKQCKTFFVRYLNRQRFCNPQCRDNFHNTARSESGRFRELRS